MKLFTKIKVAAALAILPMASAMANAGVGGSGDAFGEFATTVKDWCHGALGVGLATTMLLMGGAIGVAKNSPMPALSGVAGAAFLRWGPDIIQNVVTGGLI